MVHEKLSNTPNIALDKLPRQEEVLHKMAISAPCDSPPTTSRASRDSQPKSSPTVRILASSTTYSLTDIQKDLLSLEKIITKSNTDAARRAGCPVTSVDTGDRKVCLSPEIVFSDCVATSGNREQLLHVPERNFERALRRHRSILVRWDHPPGFLNKPPLNSHCMVKKLVRQWI